MVDAMPDVDVVSEVGDGPSALRAIEELRPDVALLDVSTPGLDSLEVVRRVSQKPSHTRTIVRSGATGGDGMRQARARGASGFLSSTADRAELEHAVREVASGKTWLDPERSRRHTAAPRLVAAAPQGLTPRLREILQLLAEGLSSKEIADRLHISTRTVEKHRSALTERLGIRSVAGLVRYAMRSGIVRSAS